MDGGGSLVQPLEELIPHMSSAIHDHFSDGGFVAWTFIEKEKQAELRKRIETYPWHLAAMDRYHLLNNHS